MIQGTQKRAEKESSARGCKGKGIQGPSYDGGDDPGPQNTTCTQAAEWPIALYLASHSVQA